jgi:hypothetical protein
VHTRKKAETTQKDCGIIEHLIVNFGDAGERIGALNDVLANCAPPKLTQLR